MKSFISILLLSLISLYAQPKDVKGWQKAEWGMSPAKIIKSFNLKDYTLNANKDTLKTKSIILKNEYLVNFVFDHEKLMLIHLTYTDSINLFEGDFTKLKEEFVKKYGKPTTSNHDPADKSNPFKFDTSKDFWVFPSTTISLIFSKVDIDFINKHVRFITMEYKNNSPSSEI